MAFFWQTPLSLSLSNVELGFHSDSEADELSRPGGETEKLQCETNNATAPSPDHPKAVERAGAFDFWKLPLPSLDLNLDLDLAGGTHAGTRDYLGVDDKNLHSADLAVDLRHPPDTDAAQDASPGLARAAVAALNAADEGAAVDADGSVSAEVRKTPSPSRSRNLAEEMTAMLTRYSEERGALQKNLAELCEMQERLRALTVKAAAEDEAVRRTAAGVDCTDSLAVAVVPSILLKHLPTELLKRILWLLDCPNLGRTASCGRSWLKLCRARGRWRKLCEQDWGVTGGGWKEYRTWLGKWRDLKSVLKSMQGTGCTPSVCGSLVRKRLFEALRTLAELGSAEFSTATYPHQVPRMLAFHGANPTLLALLEDESPHLRCLALRCLADVARQPRTRGEVREHLLRRGALVRALLEGDDPDMVEACARLLLNLHNAGGDSISTRRRGPCDFVSTPVKAGRLQRLATASEQDGCAATAAIAAAAESWCGVWTGEMCYARGGERHASLRLVLGPSSEDLAEQKLLAAAAAAAAKADPEVEANSNSQEAEGQTTTTGRQRAQAWRTPPRASSGLVRDNEGAGLSNVSGSPAACPESPPRADFWKSFGYFAASDFDCVNETLGYMDEVIQRRRTNRSSQHQSLANCQPGYGQGLLVGCGWDSESGSFSAEAITPLLPSSPATLGTAANALPLQLRLTYETRASTYHLTAFLAEGLIEAEDSDDEEEVNDANCFVGESEDKASRRSEKKRCPTLYGVWATMPSHHKHLFVLKRSASLAELRGAAAAAAAATSTTLPSSAFVAAVAATAN